MLLECIHIHLISEELSNMADYVFVSKEHARFSGFESMEEATEGFTDRLKTGSVNLICYATDNDSCYEHA